MTAGTTELSAGALYYPDVASTRFYVGALAKLSVLQYFVAESAVIGAWAGQGPYSRRTGYISDLGALACGDFSGRDVCSPAHLLMNVSFAVQGLGMIVGAFLLGSALLCCAARTGVPFARGGVPFARGIAAGPAGRAGQAARAARARWGAGVAAAGTARLLTGTAGAGTVIVGLVPEDTGSAWHVAGALMYFAAGSLALLVLGGLWLRQTPLAWIILACGVVSFAALIAGGLTGMRVPEPGTLERLMGYPITVGVAAAGLVIAQRVQYERTLRRRAR
ncbi:hypothetical protein [Arthrobacter sp. NicSoilB8]|uniref:hypothetical protein n=1 Tax=Arthrobacter sp. NicSoilB8 TaxID=2830998 RepID=UPI001CC7FEE8|nr:hypothetical protein [Arthrobacter sp. NicSoilB8]BCW69789.1 hypothetical protein NicSoilB8_08330 [Arthrobacter sp. NicSoilB8]